MKKKAKKRSLTQQKKQHHNDGEPRPLRRDNYDYHLPVLLRESVDFLVTNPDGIYIDGTLGGGGHTAEILQRLSPSGKLYSFDADIHAIEHCTQRFREELARGSESRLVLCNDNFKEACSIKEGSDPFCVSGLLLDLGVSSHQLDTDSIGLSYRVDSRLDMRFGSHGWSAEDILATYDEGELERLLRLYGEEPNARKIARRIVERRRAAPLSTTFDLRELIESTVPPFVHTKTLSRVFQALRIAVNDELGVLEQTLRGIIPMLARGGRIVVIAYHSLEDRIVKTIFKDAAQTRIPDLNNPRSLTKEIAPVLTILTKRPIEASPEELEQNPRARSAKLRVAEKA